MYQVAMASSHNDLMMNSDPPTSEEAKVRTSLVHRSIDRLLLSVLHCLRDHVGGDLSDMLDCYAGPAQHHYIDLLSSDPKPFDAADFVSRYEAAGGRLRYVIAEGGGTGVINTYPREPGALAQFLPDLTTPENFEAVSVLLHERYSAHVNQHPCEPA